MKNYFEYSTQVFHCSSGWQSRDNRRECRAAVQVWEKPTRRRFPSARPCSSREIWRCLRAEFVPSFPWKPTPWTFSEAPTPNTRGRKHWRRKQPLMPLPFRSRAQESEDKDVWRTIDALACSTFSRTHQRCSSSTSHSKSFDQRIAKSHRRDSGMNGKLGRRSKAKLSDLESKIRNQN